MTVKLTYTKPLPVATLTGSGVLRLEQELRSIHDQLNRIVDAVKELQNPTP